MSQSATADRQKAADYPVSVNAGRAEIGAEFLVHSIPSSRGYYSRKAMAQPPAMVDAGSRDAPDHQPSLVALPARPIKGCVFFASDIKAKKIKSLELEWTGPACEHDILRLR